VGCGRITGSKEKNKRKGVRGEEGKFKLPGKSKPHKKQAGGLQERKRRTVLKGGDIQWHEATRKKVSMQWEGTGKKTRARALTARNVQ